MAEIIPDNPVQPYLYLEDKHYMAYLLTNKGNHAEVSELDSCKFIQEETPIEEFTIFNVNDLLPMTYNILFQYCPINGNIILLFYEDGKDRIQNLKHQKIIPKVRKKQKIPKNEFIHSLDSYFLKQLGLSKKFSLLK